jgi:hypothetical protein
VYQWVRDAFVQFQTQKHDNWPDSCPIQTVSMLESRLLSIR